MVAPLKMRERSSSRVIDHYGGKFDQTKAAASRAAPFSSLGVRERKCPYFFISTGRFGGGNWV